MSFRKTALTSILLLPFVLVTSCSDSPAPETETITTPAAEENESPTVILDYVEETEPMPEEETTGPPIEPDKTLMKTMTCESLDPELLDEIKIRFGTPTQSIQVKVGEGLTEGEEWWLVVLDIPSDDYRDWGVRSFLTTAPGALPSNSPWIEIKEHDPWVSIKWSEEKLVTAQSAWNKALDCLKESNETKLP